MEPVAERYRLDLQGKEATMQSEELWRQSLGSFNPCFRMHDAIVPRVLEDFQILHPVNVRHVRHSCSLADIIRIIVTSQCYGRANRAPAKCEGNANFLRKDIVHCLGARGDAKGR